LSRAGHGTSRAGIERGAIAVFAPAKINLWLHVLGRRPDGYHLLDSLVAFADLGDEVAAAPADRLSLTVEGPFAASLPAADDNLALRAAHLLAAETGTTAAARLVLTKRLPVASGIGGGSADAAAALRALARLWRLDLAPDQLAALGLRLGADVPVCLGGRPAFVGGIGEAIVAAPPLPPAPLLLVNPGAALATAAVFRARTESGAALGAAAPRWTSAPADAAALAACLAGTRNDLTDAACGLVPAIRDVLDAIGSLPGCLLARMSGSGATCFGLFASKPAVESAGAALSAAHPAWWVAPTALRGGTMAG
jgi:4-diphosphocytidyl-2-C-methyl-D-erythritol kinase